jgi:aminoglycoside phosphotransferase (APT) family kinase protein
LGAGTTPNIGSFDTDRLGSWLAENVPGYEGPLEIEKFQGGQSIPTYKLAAASGAYVLRQKPSGDLLPSAHAVDREFRILSALAGGPVPVARVYGLCLDEKIIGTAFYVMAYVFGRVYWDPRLPGLSKSWRQGIFDSMNATIASLHSLDPAALGLANFGRPGNFMARQIARWSKQYRASEMESIPAMDNLIAWLPDRIPPDHEHRIVHGDYRLDNVIVDADAPQIAAVLDWELATLGDPLADFAYHVSTWRIAPELFRGLADIDFEGLGIPRESAYVAEYCRRTRRSSVDGWDFYIAYSMFRTAAILQGIAKRAHDGSAADPTALEVGRKARPLAEQAWSIAQVYRR